ncbi:MAG TPA: PEGA domain-containing protein, partial [Polyangia bacterium]|nr:PEGA domain-containing protein [Polyangia bacterium]
VTVDGRAAGETPLSIDDLSPGAHELALTAQGYASAHKKVTLEPGIRGLVSVDLLPIQGTSIVRANGPPKVFGLISMGVGAAAVAAGAAVLVAVDHKPVICPGETDLPPPNAPNARHCYRNARLPAGMLLGGGAVALVTGGLVLFVDWGPSRPGATAQGQQWIVSAKRSF